ncbi:HNT3_2 [Sanghuangporus weigelae]
MSSSNSGFDPKLFAKYASFVDPKKVLTPDICCWHTSRTLTVHEKFPKSKMHVIMIPRVGAPPRVPANLKDLYTWLTSPEVSRSEAQTLLQEMREDAEVLKGVLADKMESSHGYVGNFWMGFKVDPSYRYLHLHVMSDDLCGSYMKQPRHFFSFHPEHEQFIHLDEVLSWFEIVEERFQDNLEVMRRKKLRLKYPDDDDVYSKQHPVYDCYYKDGSIECRFAARDLSTMKAHLEEHAEKTKATFIRRKLAREERARKQAEREARLAEAKRQENAEQDDEQRGLDRNANVDEIDVVSEDQNA